MSEPPPLVVPGAVNFRDTGGLPARGGVTRHRMLLRSGSLARLEPAGRAAVAGLGLKRILDLRDDDEVRAEPSRLDDGAPRTQRVPLFLGSAASFFENDIGLDELYAHLVDESADRVAAVVRAVAHDQPVLVHCTVGKDRTGVTIALTLAAAGVEEDAIVADYARTEEMLPAARNRAIVAWLRSAHPDAVHAEELATRSPEPVMRRLLDRIARSHGSVGEYLVAAGVGEDELRELRRALVRETGRTALID